jgi:hypothetical protein
VLEGVEVRLWQAACLSADALEGVRDAVRPKALAVLAAEHPAAVLARRASRQPLGGLGLAMGAQDGHQLPAEGDGADALVRLRLADVGLAVSFGDVPPDLQRPAVQVEVVPLEAGQFAPAQPAPGGELEGVEQVFELGATGRWPRTR